MNQNACISAFLSASITNSKNLSESVFSFFNACMQITMALSRGLRIIVLTREENEALAETSDLVKLLKEKLCELAVKGTILLSH